MVITPPAHRTHTHKRIHTHTNAYTHTHTHTHTHTNTHKHTKIHTQSSRLSFTIVPFSMPRYLLVGHRTLILSVAYFTTLHVLMCVWSMTYAHHKLAAGKDQCALASPHASFAEACV